MMRLLSFLSIIAVVSAYTPSNHRTKSLIQQPLAEKVGATAGKVAATAFLALALNTSPVHAESSSTAAQISLDTLPPTTVKLAISDLPVLGNLLSGTYTKVPDESVAKPSVTITSPKDKVSAVKAVATGGHLEFDVNGAIGTHLDVDIAADKAGVATVRVASPLIPKLPFKNLASTTPPKSGKPSEWSSVTNLGNGETYYFNEKTGTTQYQKPDILSKQ